MSSGNQIRRRSGRVAQLELPPGQFAKVLAIFRRGDVLSRIAICIFSAVVMWLVTTGWRAPFPYRLSQTPVRDIIASVNFQKLDLVKTAEKKQQARRSIEFVYDHNPQILDGVRETLESELFIILEDKPYEEVDQTIWKKFQTESGDPAGGVALTEEESQQKFETFRQAFREDPALEVFDARLSAIFADVFRNGFLEKLDHGVEQGSQTAITVRLPNDTVHTNVPVDDIRRAKALVSLQHELTEKFADPLVADHLFAWLKSKLPSYTLTKNEAAIFVVGRCERGRSGTGPANV